MTTIRTFGLACAPIALACVAASATWSSGASAQTRYTASWASVDTHNPAPEWFQDAKFGIYYHWGAFGTPMYGSEWYPRNMYHSGSGEYDNNVSKYGDPKSDWPYNKFIDGGTAKDGTFVQFAPKLASAGGKWDPEEWADLVVGAGVKFAGPVAEHHDGYSMWDSKVNEWNSVGKGPKLDLVGLQLEAYRKRGVRVMVSLHHAFNIQSYYDQAPTPSDDSLKKLYGKLPAAQGQQLWLDKLKEVIAQYKPDLIWQDFDLGGIDEAKRLDFLATFYNMGLDEGKEVVATAKDGILEPHKGQVKDYERGGPADITTPYWLTDDAVSSSSWCYTQGLRYYSTNALIHSFLDRVSKGGNLLLNMSPMPDGSWPQEQKDILAAFGKFLKQNGTAVYNTRTFAVYGEGPTKMGGGGMGQPTAMTSSDIRYTKSKDGDAVYALLMGWPGDGNQVNLTAVTTSRFDLGSGKVFLFGPNGDGTGETVLTATQDGSGVHVTLPSTQPYTSVAYALKLSKAGTPPEATDWTPDSCSDGSCSTGGTGGTGPTGGAGGSAGTAAGGNSTTGGVATGGTGTGRGGRTGAGGVVSTGGTGPRGGVAPTGGTASGGASPTTGGASVGGTTAAAGGTAQATGGSIVGPTGGATALATGGTTASGGAATQPAGGASAVGVGGTAPTENGGTAASSGSSGTENDESAGCGCRLGRSSSNSGVLLALLGLCGLGLRRRRDDV
jgi:alpha-L-fucosidase